VRVRGGCYLAKLRVVLLRYLALGETARHDLRRAQVTAASTAAAATALPHEVREAHAATLGASRSLHPPDVRMQCLWA